MRSARSLCCLIATGTTVALVAAAPGGAVGGYGGPALHLPSMTALAHTTSSSSMTPHTCQSSGIKGSSGQSKAAKQFWVVACEQPPRSTPILPGKGSVATALTQIG